MWYVYIIRLDYHPFSTILCPFHSFYFLPFVFQWMASSEIQEMFSSSSWLSLPLTKCNKFSSWSVYSFNVFFSIIMVCSCGSLKSTSVIFTEYKNKCINYIKKSTQSTPLFAAPFPAALSTALYFTNKLYSQSLSRTKYCFKINDILTNCWL